MVGRGGPFTSPRSARTGGRSPRVSKARRANQQVQKQGTAVLTGSWGDQLVWEGRDPADGAWSMNGGVVLWAGHDVTRLGSVGGVLVLWMGRDPADGGVVVGV